jgi:hypothetical protein
MKKNTIFSNAFEILAVALIILVGCEKETNSLDDYLNQLPQGLKLDNSTPQSYQLTEIYYSKNIDGTFSDKAKITAQYTRGLPDDYVKWNNVYFSFANDSINQTFTSGIKQEYMENFTYVPTDSLLTYESLYKNFPSTFPNKIYAINLIWDIYGLEIMAWLYFDSLKLNIPYHAGQINVKVPILLTDFTGTYYTRDLQLTWSGVTKLNNENCAIIDFIALNNLTEYYLPGLHLQGNEDYWGTVYVSLKNKQIEYGVFDNSTTQSGEVIGANQNFNSQLTREVKVERIN